MLSEREDRALRRHRREILRRARRPALPRLPACGKSEPVKRSFLRAIGAAAIAVFLAVPSAHAQVTVSNAWVRGTVAPQTATGAFMEIRSTESVSLVAARTPVAKTASVHEMSMSGGVMRMRPIAKLDIGANETVTLAPGGYHVMLEGLKKPLSKGESVPFSLVFEKKGGERFTVKTAAKVVGLAEAGPPPMAPMH